MNTPYGLNNYYFFFKWHTNIKNSIKFNPINKNEFTLIIKREILCKINIIHIILQQNFKLTLYYAGACMCLCLCVLTYDFQEKICKISITIENCAISKMFSLSFFKQKNRLNEILYITCSAQQLVMILSTTTRRINNDNLFQTRSIVRFVSESGT